MLEHNLNIYNNKVKLVFTKYTKHCIMYGLSAILNIN